MIRAGVVSGSASAAAELFKILEQHPSVTLVERFINPSKPLTPEPTESAVANATSGSSEQLDIKRLTACDLVFFTACAGDTLHWIDALYQADVRVIDLGESLRLRDTQMWERWYQQPHTHPALAAQVVYGVPEINRAQIASAQLVVPAGCYASAAMLALAPLIEAKLIDLRRIIYDCKLGETAQSAEPALDIRPDQVSAFNVNGHRQLPELRQALYQIAERPVGITFVGHQVPAQRGVYATLYPVLKDAIDPGLHALFTKRYADAPFVQVLDAGEHPSLLAVQGTNHCQLSVFMPQYDDTLVVIAALDDQLKGGVGQAVQCMNIMFGLDEQLGISG